MSSPLRHILRSKCGVVESALAGKSLGMILRNRPCVRGSRFEIGVSQLGGKALYPSRDEVGLGQREAVGDVAQVLSHSLMEL